MTDLPNTPLDDYADDLDAEFERVKDDPALTGMSHSPKQMLEDDVAVVFDLPVMGKTFRVLAYQTHSNFRGRRLTTIVYEYENPPWKIDDTVRHTDYLNVKHLDGSEIADDEAADDTAHRLATSIGYHVRYLLDGRNYRWSHTPHDEPPTAQ